MKPKIVENKYLKEKYYYMKHPSGLDIYVYPKPDYSSSYAVLGTNFGSVDSKFRLKGNPNYTSVPDGIAHYLEHKLFESKQGDAFKLFSKTGASANAYTSFEKTAYLFSCTENFEQSLNILLNFVQSPYFTEQNVEKERGIIGQEIKMYEDSPDWKVLINLLGILYKNHPVKKDIAGTIDSIAKITPTMLYECYNAFYNPHNMVLCIVGNANPEQIFAIADKNLKYSEKIQPERFIFDEPRDVVKKEITQKFNMQSSMFSLGFKEQAVSSRRATTEELVYTDILLSYLCSPTSDMYQELLKKELINTYSFSSEYFEGPGYASIIFSGESKDPRKAAKIIKSHTQKLKTKGFDLQNFERAKKTIYGQSISMFDSISDTANTALDFALTGRELFDYMNILQSASLEQAEKNLGSHLDGKYSALSIAEPKDE